MAHEHVPVLIVGGGIVGLSASLFLLQHGIPSLLVERHSGTSIHPRARGVNVRTMEIFRELGLEDEVREAGAALQAAMGLLRGATLAGALEHWSPEQRQAAMKALAAFGNLDTVSPAVPSRATQDLLEPVLLAAARQRGGDLRFSTEMVAFTQDDDGVTATIRDRASGAEHTIRADYMIAADGARTPIRSALGAPTSGRGTLGYLLNILFQADMRDLVRDREFSLCLIEHPDMHGLFASINNADRWVFHLVYEPGKGETPADFPPERCAELLRLALGMPDIAIEIKSILPWECAECVADAFRHGRIFLAGDAAHQMPPWGGQGANSGVADAHNLAWKLAYVIKGLAAPALLDTYDAERIPVGRVAADESARAADARGLLSLDRTASALPDRLPRLLGYGYQYRSSAIISAGEEAPSAHPVGLDGRPGTRAPHVWVEDQGRRISTLDLLGGGFVLLAGPGGGAWRDAARTAASATPRALAAYCVGPDGDLRDRDDHWLAAGGVEADGALLIRPDGFIAWRSKGAASAPEQVLARVLAQVLGHGPPPSAS